MESLAAKKLPPAVPPPGALTGSTAGTTSKVGNLVYTKAGLFTLFCWLLWGDFVFTLFEHSFMPILQFKLDDLGASPRTYILITGTLPNLMHFFLNPIVSVRSDRHRGPRGRRIPFLLYGSPLVSVFLVLMGFGEDIGFWLQQNFFSHMPANVVLLWVFAILFLLFGFFNTFVNGIFGYLFNDVMPRNMLIRFTAWFRMIGVIANGLYMWFLYQWSDKYGPFTLDLGFYTWHTDRIWYPKLILIGLSVFYLIGFTIMCFKVKEPEYPPPAPLAEKIPNPLVKLGRSIKVMAYECFGHKFYWVFFGTMMLDWMATTTGTYQQLLWRSLGIDLGDLGKVSVANSVVSFILLGLCAGIGDRIKPLPFMIMAMAGMVITAPIGLLYLIPDLTPRTYLIIRAVYLVTHIPINVLYSVAVGPMSMQLLPRDKFGQFSSASAMLRMLLAGVIGTYVTGEFMGLLKWLHGNGDYYLRYVHAWSMFFQILALIGMVWMYRMWKELGGKEGYTPPVSTRARVT